MRERLAGYFEGDVKVLGSVATAYVKKTADYTAKAGDSIIAVDATSGVVVITLPAASGKEGRAYTIKKIDSSVNSVTVDGNGSETIDGVSAYSLSTQWKYVSIYCDGANWLITANN